MHPATSVILFTTLSGVGFGFLAWLGVDPSPPTGLGAFWAFTLAFGLAVGGLIASTFHLGHPERAWRAFSQWRSSWLSREAICAVAALLVMAVYAAALIFAGRHLPLAGWIGAALSLLTVFTTSMIYGQLKTIPRWNTPLTSALFLSYALTGGALLSGRITAAVMLLVITALLQFTWWRRGDSALAESGSTLGTATRLSDRGTVRSVAHPHSSPNYLMREFIHVIGRKHAQKLRIIALLLTAALPILILVFIPAPTVALALAALIHLAGVATARWLFFAEAEHTVGLYYGLR
ncbi:dimethyl sulfoxide reductase anchor subunit family protein [Palleronia caenipelagi]|uniref:Dibenzothiophene desulfurase n=1 Tax=Palleronia caenipelagi TaxID=2489174 RepID=A0A547PK20_9RHOB|nr:DmsC/YnfH family molybdoenzyme membrane anchor subunit [Palleronia caenipelagi]TRD14505.1 dibenzothiophene desulfurase [Palleronia caenipelagi]